jgi:hypothetical protein
MKEDAGLLPVAVDVSGKEAMRKCVNALREGRQL